MSIEAPADPAGPFLSATPFIDSDHPGVRGFARRHGRGSGIDVAVALYYAVRDGIRYDPYLVGADRSYFRASDCLARGRGFCIPKSVLLAAVARASAIPARLGFADVRNHLSTPRMTALVGGDIYTWHSYTEMWLDGRWVKSTPAFNRELCERFGVHPLEFDGRSDSLLQEFDRAGQRHMEYLTDRGIYADVPYDSLIAAFESRHPRWLHNRAESAADGRPPREHERA